MVPPCGRARAALSASCDAPERSADRIGAARRTSPAPGAGRHRSTSAPSPASPESRRAAPGLEPGGPDHRALSGPLGPSGRPPDGGGSLVEPQRNSICLVVFHWARAATHALAAWMFRRLPMSRMTMVGDDRRLGIRLFLLAEATEQHGALAHAATRRSGISGLPSMFQRVPNHSVAGFPLVSRRVGGDPWPAVSARGLPAPTQAVVPGSGVSCGCACSRGPSREVVWFPWLRRPLDPLSIEEHEIRGRTERAAAAHL
jgi:hypothetical protein